MPGGISNRNAIGSCTRGEYLKSAWCGADQHSRRRHSGIRDPRVTIGSDGLRAVRSARVFGGKLLGGTDEVPMFIVVRDRPSRSLIIGLAGIQSLLRAYAW
jgi:hypothetical protein